VAYVTSNILGVDHTAGIGSQLYHYACLYGISKDTGKGIALPTEVIDHANVGITVDKIIDIDITHLSKSEIASFTKIQCNPISLEFETACSDTSDTNYNFVGSFYNYRHFSPKYDFDIRSIKWNKELYQTALNKYNMYKDTRETVAVHVRLGDYVSHKSYCHYENTDYYEKAVSTHFSDQDRFNLLVFSNEINTCKQKYASRKNMVFVDCEGDDAVDLIVMSMCDHQIIANSTYSWWSAYKNGNPDKVVVCPRNFLSPYHNLHVYLNDKYYLKDWKVIDAECV